MGLRLLSRSIATVVTFAMGALLFGATSPNAIAQTGAPQTASGVNSQGLEIYKPGQVLWVSGVFGTANWFQAVPTLASDDLFRLYPLPRQTNARFGFYEEASGRPFFNNPSPFLSNLVVGVGGDVEFGGPHVTQSADFLGGSLQQSYNSSLVFEQFVGIGEEIHLTNQTLVIPNFRVGVAEAQYHYTTIANFGATTFAGDTSGVMTGWEAGLGIDLKTQGLPGFQVLWVHREFPPTAIGLPSTNLARQAVYENELRFGFLASNEHIWEFLRSLNR